MDCSCIIFITQILVHVDNIECTFVVNNIKDTRINVVISILKFKLYFKLSKVPLVDGFCKHN